MSKEKLSELERFLNSYRENSIDEKATNRGVLIAKRQLFVENHILQYHMHVQSFSHSKGSYSSDDGYYRDFLEKFKKYSHIGKTENQQIIDSFVEAAFQDNSPLRIYKLFLSEIYKPPVDPFQILIHLLVLYIFYKYLAAKAPLTVLLQFDLVMAQLAHQVAINYMAADGLGKDSDRVRKSKVVKKDKKAGRKL